MANITAHELPSGDGEKMRADDPTNDPRPFFRRTLTNNSITNPPFTRKSNPSPHTKRGGNEMKNIARSRHGRSQRATMAKIRLQRSKRATKGHERDITKSRFQQSHRAASRLKEPHTTNPSNSEKTERTRETVQTCLPGRAQPTLLLICYQVEMER